ncbi:HEAT repeat domain-containing protein [Halalkalicoccus jeotgali]|uniref:PBS lyase HEAT-like repeat domain protein n=2 Tax=Halalkalicoccus jeotgali TaxID=413810 RepID=D8J4S8_HALJB|nr:HEAT repeat domain-containing protein [Halalkalicoccus jeotgali]ADJ15545.1 PBS lyase HEAT-like repeat domain protein [Halalkalicoccus jeotgali B3]ELY36046.1 PBS lyase HEAT-like repeat domain-containing protein [Halalkalicoccus jeotgali B3]
MSEDAPDESEAPPEEEEAPDETQGEDADETPETPADGDTEDESTETEERESNDEAGGDADEPEEGGEESTALTEPLTEESLDERLDGAEAALEEAETESDLDDVSATLVSIGDDLEEADLPEPEADEDEDEEEAEDPRERLESRLSDLQDDLESQRGPYSEDVIEGIEEAGTTIDETRWTETGEAELVAPVEAFIERENEILGTDLGLDGEEPASLVTTLESAAAAVGDASLDPDEDEEEIAALLDAVEELQAGIEDAEEWDDLTTREKLAAHGFYDVLDHRKDYPPEWHAIKVYEKRGEAEPILLALDQLGSEFMERHCIESLTRMGAVEALDVMTQRANKRDKPAITALGKIGSDDSVEMLTEYAASDGDPKLQLVTLKALGEIGSEEATQAVADRLTSENPEVRSAAARSLGLIGDTRAISPLSDVLEDDDADSVRASAAWALNQIGTEDALEAVEPYADDRAFLVQSEARKVA